MARTLNSAQTNHSVRAADQGLAIERCFTREGVHPFDEIEWEIARRRDRRSGQAGLRAARRRVPEELVAERDQHRRPEVLPRAARHAQRERSVKQMVGRVAGTIAAWGRDGGYFASAADAETFEAELTHILVNQLAAFNSPVWFNVGFEESPQCSACFILSVEDTMESILDWNTKEGMIFRGGSGSGHQPLEDPLLEGAALQGRPCLGPGLLHARGRRVGRHDQVGRQDAARGQDGGARRRPPGHQGVHLVQGARGGEGRGAARGRLRHVDRRRGLPLDPVPEREQLRARDRRVPRRGRARRGVADDRARERRAGRDASTPAR